MDLTFTQCLFLFLVILYEVIHKNNNLELYTLLFSLLMTQILYLMLKINYYFYILHIYNICFIPLTQNYLSPNQPLHSKIYKLLKLNF